MKLIIQLGRKLLSLRVELTNLLRKEEDRDRKARSRETLLREER